jgi:serine/threonine protein kinase
MTDDPLIGRQLANFLIERVLGRGGMAQVYYGQDVKLQRPVAIKVIDARYRSKPVYAQRFVKEARSVAKWRHENIIHIYYADDEDGLYYYVMEYIDGHDLSTVMSAYTGEGELMPPEEILRIGRAVASALDFAHKKGVIHRDVKPSNVMMSEDGRVVLGDFGLALDMQEGSSGEVFGTPHYISPEQARRSKDVVPQSDIYSLGVILYEMLTGVVPFDDLSPTSVALQHITQPPPPPRSINPQLNIETEQVLLKVLSKAPHDRYQSGAELMDALEKALAQQENAQAKVLPLPPIPAAILSGQAPTMFQNPSGILDETQLHVPEPEEPAAVFVDSEPPVPPRVRKKGAGFWPVAALLGLVVFLLIAGTLFFDPSAFKVAIAFFSTPTFTRQPTTAVSAKTPTIFAPTVSASVTVSATFVNTPTPTASPLATATEPAVAIAAIASASPTETVTPTITVSPTPSPTEEMPTAAITETPTAESAPPSTVIPTPTTVKYPNGKHFLLFYDHNGLYLVNVSDEKRSLDPFTFERLDDSGLPLSRFEGWHWAQFYPILYPGTCIKTEIPKGAEYAARPVQCENRYVGARFDERDSEFIFWTAQDNSSQFRVLWNDEEVAVCEIERGACEVWVP